MSIISLGLVVADVIGNPVVKLPRPGTLERGPQISLHPGGCAVNTGSALARLGIPSSLIGAVGEDSFGSYLRQELGERGLDLRGLKTFPNAKTSASLVFVNAQGERSFIHEVGANAQISERQLDWSFIRKHRMLHVAGSFLMPALDGAPLARVLRRARSMGLLTSLDTVYNPRLNWKKILQPCLPHLDYFLPSYEEARQITGKTHPADMAEVFLGLGAQVVAIKMGGKGSFIHDGKQAQQVPAHRIRAVDTTGAGDAFCAGFLAGISKGWELLASVQLANTLGASCCLEVGAYEGIPSWQEATRRLKRWYGSR